MKAQETYEEVMEQARRLAIEEQLRLISDLSANLSQRVRATRQGGKTSADFYGVMRGVEYDESDFVAAEWHPAE